MTAPEQPPSLVPVETLRQWLMPIDPTGAQHLADVVRARYCGDRSASYETIGAMLGMTPDEVAQAAQAALAHLQSAAGQERVAATGNLAVLLEPGTRLHTALQAAAPATEPAAAAPPPATEA